MLPNTTGVLKGVRRQLLLAGGLVCVGLGLVGVVLPGLPPTPFLLVASFCFARSSPALHKRLLDHPRVGPGLRHFSDTRSVPRRVKLTALTAVWLGVSYSVFSVASTAPILSAVIVASGLTGTAVLLFWVRTDETVVPVDSIKR